MKIRSVFLIALTLLRSASFAHAAQSFRLFEIFSLRYVNDSQGIPIIDRGEFKHDIYQQIAPGATIPSDAMNRNLLPVSLWPAYDAVGKDALANFNLNESILVNGVAHFLVKSADHPNVDVGNLANLSTRGTITPGGEPLIGGFVVEDHPRRILIRGVGPTLSSFGVAAPLANPTIKIFHQGEAAALVANDDWEQQAGSDEVAAAAVLVGAFPLGRASKDAALLIELPPGNYTAHLASGDTTGGTALLEIYILP